MKQGFLFPDEQATPSPDAGVRQQAAPIFMSQTDDNGRDWGDFDSCLKEFGTNHCTLEDQPARIVGTPRTAQYATIEPVDLDAEPIRCHWDVVDMVMQEGRTFIRDDDDTDE